MNLIEKEIEAKVAALLVSALAGIDGVRVEGSWQTDSSAVKGEESPSDKVMVGVATGSPSFESFGFPACDIPVSVACVIRHELSPGGDALSEVMERIATLFLSLQFCESERVHEDLSTDNFTANGVRVDPGEAPVYDREEKTWTVTRSMTVRGVASLYTENT